MKPLKIAVTSQNFRTVTGHAGRARRFLVYEAAPGVAPVETARLDLPLDQSVHDSGGAGAHPIDGVDVVLSAGFGEHFAALMTQRGIVAATTTQDDPVAALREYLRQRAAGTLPPVVGCDCGGACDGDGHEHHHVAAAAG